MKRVIIPIIALLLFSACNAGIKNQQEKALEVTPESGIQEEQSQYEAFPHAWIEVNTLSYGEGYASFGFEETPWEGKPDESNHPEGIFFNGPVSYIEYLIVFDQNGNLLEKYQLDIFAYDSETTYSIHLSGNYLFYSADISVCRIDLTDNISEHFTGVLYSDNGAVIIGTYPNGFREDDLSTEMQIEVWMDGDIAHTFVIPVEIWDYNTYSAAANPEYLPEQDTLLFYDPAHKYTITLSTGAMGWEYNFPNPPQEILALSKDLCYTISHVRYDPQSIGSYYYCHDNEAGENRPLTIAYYPGVRVSGNYATLNHSEGIDAFDLATGSKLSTEFVEYESLYSLDVVYLSDSDRWIRALMPPLYAVEKEIQLEATITLEISDGNGEVFDSIDTPFHIYYGKMEANDICLDVWGSQIVMLEWSPASNLQVLSIGLMDLETKEFSRMDGDAFCVYENSLYIAEYNRQNGSNQIDSIAVRQYRDGELVAGKEVDYRGAVDRMYYNPQSQEVVGCTSNFYELFRLSLEDSAMK